MLCIIILLEKNSFSVFGFYISFSYFLVIFLLF